MSNQIIVGVDVGTSKIAVTVAETNKDGSVSVLGVGQSVSQGVRKGEIVDVDAATGAVRAAVEQAEQNSGVEVREVYASVTGGHIRSFNNRGHHTILTEDGEVTEEDVEKVLLNASAIGLPTDNVPLIRVKRLYRVDGQSGVENPVGMHAEKLELELHIIHGVKTRLQNTLKAIRQVPLEIQGYTFSPLASALAVLSPQQKEIGALLIDIGGGTTDYVLYSGGTAGHSGVFAVGGDHVTNDLLTALKIPINRAENLKLEHGTVEVSDAMAGQEIAMKSDVGLPERRVSKQLVARVMRMRMEELLQLVRNDLDKHGLREQVGAGVYLTGGVSRTPGLRQLAQDVLELPVYIGRTETVSGVHSALESPEFATSIGLARYGALQEAGKPARTGFWARLASKLGLW
jgi:cell division protein FtsA